MFNPIKNFRLNRARQKFRKAAELHDPRAFIGIFGRKQYIPDDLGQIAAEELIKADESLWWRIVDLDTLNILISGAGKMSHDEIIRQRQLAVMVLLKAIQLKPEIGSNLKVNSKLISYAKRPDVFDPLTNKLAIQALGIINNSLSISPEKDVTNTRKGIRTLEELCRRTDILDEMDWIDQAEEELKTDGENASQSIANLISELLECRSPKLLILLILAGRLQSTPELIEAIHSVVSSNSIAQQPQKVRFASEIAGNGQVGWTDYTAGRIKHNATRALEILSQHEKTGE